MSAGVGMIHNLAALARQGKWTNDPSDPNYPNHWNMRPLGGDEVVSHVYTGSMGGRLSGGLVNVRVADGPSGRVVYVDKPKIQRFGPVAMAVGKLADRAGTFTPARYERTSIRLAPRGGRVRISTDDGLIKARSDIHIGHSGDLSAREQLRNTWKLLRG